MSLTVEQLEYLSGYHNDAERRDNLTTYESLLWKKLLSKINSGGGTGSGQFGLMYDVNGNAESGRKYSVINYIGDDTYYAYDCAGLMVAGVASKTGIIPGIAVYGTIMPGTYLVVSKTQHQVGDNIPLEDIVYTSPQNEIEAEELVVTVGTETNISTGLSIPFGQWVSLNANTTNNTISIDVTPNGNDKAIFSMQNNDPSTGTLVYYVNALVKFKGGKVIGAVMNFVFPSAISGSFGNKFLGDSKYLVTGQKNVTISRSAFQTQSAFIRLPQSTNDTYTISGVTTTSGLRFEV